ncbi:epoxide hydrolase [Amnibacterium setariae]|uniref:Epoxide hydrolase n=1 Tax=Amnibacterium setariae TaxID=2306585 RepID=A0A3A1U1J4_9MICO|nr:epoxide hydrolase [Amnibacterium setariae]
MLDDLRRRLRDRRRVPVVGGGWSRGVDAAYLDDLLSYWAEEYDWRAAEERIRALPWTRAAGLRLVHRRATAEDAPVVVLLHGWPDSVLRFQRVLPLLQDLHVVVPALPGYPLSDSPGTAGALMAEPVAAALQELGHDRYVVSGGDIGTSVAEALARLVPDRVTALHLTDVPSRVLGLIPEAERSAGERAFAQEVRAWTEAEGAYLHEQATKPATLAVGLGDSPAGLAAWIVEKLRSWSDCDGDVEAAFPRDDLLTWITLYWVTGAIGTSFAPYAERLAPVRERVVAPTAVSLFPEDLLHAPRELAERTFDVRVWDEQPAGGHFAAWERPEAFVASLRAAIALA